MVRGKIDRGDVNPPGWFGVVWWPLYIAIVMPLQLLRFFVAPRSRLWGVVKHPGTFAGHVFAGGSSDVKTRMEFLLDSRIFDPASAWVAISGRMAREREFPEEWGYIRRRTYSSDSHTCVVCERAAPDYSDLELHADHVIPRKWGGGEEDENLRTLCADCHAARHLTVYPRNR